MAFFLYFIGEFVGFFFYFGTCYDHFLLTLNVWSTLK
jgi:hypothetical protein